MKYLINSFLFCSLGLSLIGCSNTKTVSEKSNKIELMLIQPEHFHAALVQKYMHEEIDSSVYLFAEDTTVVEGYQSLLHQFNTRDEKPTHWHVNSYYGDDFLDKAFQSNGGNVVVLAGDNHRKIDYISGSVASGKDVFADKPLVINDEGYDKLVNLLRNNEKTSAPIVYDIMTERYDIKNRIIKALLGDRDFSGGMNQTKDRPAIQYSSTHHFIKEVSGKPLIRPAMFYNTLQQGEGLVDVTTHYIDLVYWMLSSEEPINIDQDLQLDSSYRWSTRLTKNQFVKSTNSSDYPSFLKPSQLEDGSLAVFSNGKMNFTFKGVPVSIAVEWKVESADGTGDRFSAIFNAKNFRVEVKPNQAGQMSVYVVPHHIDDHFEKELLRNLQSMSDLPGLSFIKEGQGYQIVIPQELYLSHEEHFSKVLEQFVSYRKERTLPEWEKSFLLAKYYLTTKALKQAKTIKHEEN